MDVEARIVSPIRKHGTVKIRFEAKTDLIVNLCNRYCKLDNKMWLMHKETTGGVSLYSRCNHGRQQFYLQYKETETRTA